VKAAAHHELAGPVAREALGRRRVRGSGEPLLVQDAQAVELSRVAAEVWVVGSRVAPPGRYDLGARGQRP
jgi:hypothetical protein